MRTMRRIVEEDDIPSIYSREVQRIKAMRKLALEGPPSSPTREALPEIQWPATEEVLVWLAVLFGIWFFWNLYVTANPVNDEVPKGRAWTLSGWLKYKAPPKPAGSFGGRPPPPREERATGQVTTSANGTLSAPPDVELTAVQTAGELWESYAFTTRQIVEEVPSMVLEGNFLISLALRLLAFPTVYGNWEQYEACAVDEVTLGPKDSRLAPIDKDKSAPLPDQGLEDPREVVLECGRMIDDYGLSLVARGSQGIVGTATLRTKRLPEGCHINYDNDAPSVVCDVDLDAIYAAGGLEAVAYLESIAVARGWRGSGLARSMLDFVEEKARTWGLTALALHVHRDNWSALRFYQRRGYETTSDWLGWGDTFFLLLKPL